MTSDKHPLKRKRTFVGRRDIIETFINVLRNVIDSSQPSTSTGRSWDQYDEDDDEEAVGIDDKPYILLVSGHGGIGKSHLLERFYNIAHKAQLEGLCCVFPIIRLETGNRFTVGERRSVDPIEVFTQLANALNFNAPSALPGWQSASKNVSTTTGNIADNNGMVAVGSDIQQARHEFGSVNVWINAEHSRSSMEDQIAQINPLALPALQKEKHKQLIEMRTALSHDLRNLSEERPLVILLDTYELIDTADLQLRPLFLNSGWRVIWVIAGRNNLVLDRPGFERSEPFRGYESESLVTRLLDMSLKELTPSDVRAFLEKEGLSLDAEQADKLYTATHGNALALNMAVHMLKQHQSLNQILRDEDTPLLRRLAATADTKGESNIVYQMANRLLLYCMNEQDKRSIYAMALARRPTFDLLTAMIQPADKLHEHLEELARQYDFVEPRRRKLHDTVGYFVHEKLQEEAREGNEQRLIAELNKRACEYSLGALRQREAELNLHKIDRLMHDGIWRDHVHDYLYHVVWFNPEQGVRELIAAFCIARAESDSYGGVIHGLAASVKPVVSAPASQWLAMLLDWDSSSEQSIINVLNMVKQWNIEEIIWHPDPSHSNQEALAAAYYLAGAFYDPGVRHIGSSDAAAETIDSNKALEMYQAGLQMSDRLRVLIQSSAFALYELGRYDEELQILCRAIDADPAHSGAYAWRGQVYGVLQQYDEALADYTRALELEPDNPEIRRMRGDVYRLMSQYEQALVDLNRAIELESKSSVYLNQRGLIYVAMQRYEEALADYTQSLDLQLHPDVLGNRGNTYHRLGQYEPALEDYTHALEIDANNLYTLNERALVYRDIYQYENALADFTRYLEFNPNAIWVVVEQSRVYRNLRRYDEALANYDRIIKLESDNPDPRTVVHRGNCYAYMGQFEQAFADYEYARSLGTYQDWPLFGMAITFALQGKSTETLHYLQQAIAIDAQVKQSASQGYHYEHAFQPLRNRDPMFAADFDALVADNPPAVEQTERLKEVIATFAATFSALNEVQQTVLLALSACAQPTHAAMVAPIAGCTVEEAQTALIHLKEQSLIHYEAGQDRPYSLPSAVQIVVSQQARAAGVATDHLAFAQARVQAYQHIDDQQALGHDLPEILTAIDRCIAADDIQRAWDMLQPMQGWLTAHGRQNDFTSRCWQILSRAPEHDSIQSGLANFLCKSGHIRLARICLEQLIPLYKRHQNLVSLANVYGSLGDYSYLLDQEQVATEYYEKAIEISQAANMATAQSRWLGQLGICHLMLNNVSQAIDCLVQAVSFDERQGDIEQQSMHLEMLGHCYRTKYEPAEAIKYYQKALELDNQRGHSQRQDTHQRNLDICHNLINNIPMETIIYPEDVSDNLDLKNYFWQRLGPDFDELPYILVDRDDYLSLLHGENALLSEMLIEDEEAANEIFFAFASDKLNRVIMTFHIESPDVGNRAVAFIEARKRTSLHENWFQEMKQLAQAMQKLHREWQQQGMRYYEVGVVRRFKPPL